MKSYLLLRDNQQSGPYTFEEIKQQQLHAFDLVWIEGKSNSWSYPTELRELKPYVSAKRSSNPVKASTSTSTATTSFNSVTSSTFHNTAAAAYGSYEEVDRALFTERKPLYRRRSIPWAGNVLALVTIVIGTVMAAYVVKGIVESFGSEGPLASAEATQVESISYQSEHAAMAASRPLVQSASITEEALQISEDALPARPTESEKQQIINDSRPAEAIAKENTADPAATINAEVPKENTAAATEMKDEATEIKKVSKDVKTQLQLSSNDYKVGALGGISNLELQLTNSSSSTVERATVEVNFMKPNGSVIGTETIEVRNIQPGHSKKIPVPSSSRGVKVGYRVTDVDAHDNG